MRKKTGILLIIVLVLLICVTGVYLAIGAHYTTHFFRNTVINGIDVSECTAEEAEALIAEGADSYRLVITGRELSDDEHEQEQETIPGTAFDYHYVFNGEAENFIKNQDSYLWLFNYFLGRQSFTMNTAVYYDEGKLQTAVASLSFMQEDQMTAPQNAYVARQEDGTYAIVPETEGTELDPEQMEEAVRTAVRAGRKSLNLEMAECYRTAAVTSDNEALITECNLKNKYAAMVINCYMGGDVVVALDASVFMNWFSLDENNTPAFDYDSVAAWVGALADAYDTIGTWEPFVTSNGVTVSVQAVSYGWQMDRSAETEELYALLLAGETVGHSPVWTLSAAARAENDVGDTYVEIDYTNQRLWYYKDGALLVETPVVTGNVNAGNASPEGMYFIYYKERDAILEGEGYQTPVSYWMPFFDNVGIHDADTWRSEYGGAIYLSSGSHGCINTPTAMAAVIYDNIEAGTPVICYSSGIDYGYGTASGGTVMTAETEAPAAAEPAEEIQAAAEAVQEAAAETAEEIQAAAEAAQQAAAETAEEIQAAAETAEEIQAAAESAEEIQAAAEAAQEAAAEPAEEVQPDQEEGAGQAVTEPAENPQPDQDSAEAAAANEGDSWNTSDAAEELGLVNDYTTETNSIYDADDNENAAAEEEEEPPFDIIIYDETIWPEGTPQEDWEGDYIVIN